jgi:hypothetical protein
VLLVMISILAGWLPAYLPEGDDRRNDILGLLPTAMLSVLVVALISASAAGGGRELLPRDEGVAFPLSPLTDHLGALLMAPLNIAWLLQAWTLLGATAFVAGASPGLVLTQLLMCLWLAAATAAAQVVSWGLEWVRRGPGGPWFARMAVAVAAAVAGWLVATGRLVPLLQESPTLKVAVAALQGSSGLTPLYVVTWAGLLLATFGLVAVGGSLAGVVARRPAREELRLDSSVHPARPHPGSDLLALMRTDRVSIWRSLPLRRGLTVLALMPGLVAVAAGMEWGVATILPGLVASGGALVFGVNSWCLDGRGALWRDSLPVEPGLVFASRTLVLIEVLLVATAGTTLLASLRAGVPSAAEAAAVACCAVVVVLQVVSASLRWSVRRPFAVDLRSARATPAPPLVMVGYSSRLALSTTFVGLLFSGLARTGPVLSLLVALPLVLLSAWRLTRTARAWGRPEVRSSVITTVVG